MAVCNVCFRHCNIEEGRTGFCGGRICVDGKVIAGNYGRITSIALDPIEKKPLRNFHPGSNILSIGSYGCNLRCPFCQNSGISWSDDAMYLAEHAPQQKRDIVSPEKIASMAEEHRAKNNIGVAFTYNEPLIGYEFVRDTAKLVQQAGMKNVMVTNGTAELHVLAELLPYIDGMNIDIKGFTDKYYRDLLKGDLSMVKAFIQEAVKSCHVELTTLIVPGENESIEEMDELTDWISGLTDGKGNVIGRQIPLHISRFFPRFHMTDRDPTDPERIYDLVELAREKLDHVYPGNC